jgi:DNA-binding CsgD family transcriptional regulator
MTESVSPWTRDLAVLSALIEPAFGDSTDVLFPWATFDGLAALIPCDSIFFAELDIRGQRRIARQELIEGSERVVSFGAGEPVADESVYWAHRDSFWASAPQSRRGIWRWSDVYSTQRLRNVPLYAEFFAPTGLRHFMTLSFPAPAGRSRHLQFFRHTDRPFSDGELQLLCILRPHLQELYDLGQRRRRGRPQLSPREWQVMTLVARGYDNAQIARTLRISVNTVRKHLEHVFERTGVRSRTAAVARLLPFTGAD